MHAEDQNAWRLDSNLTRLGGRTDAVHHGRVHAQVKAWLMRLRGPIHACPCQSSVQTRLEPRRLLGLAFQLALQLQALSAQPLCLVPELVGLGGGTLPLIVHVVLQLQGRADGGTITLLQNCVYAGKVGC